MEPLTRAQKTFLLTKSAASYWLHLGYSCVKEMAILPWGKRRVDFVALNYKADIVVCEVKSSLSDYRADKKWREYLPFCNRFYFVLDETTFETIKDELKELHKETGIGVLVLGPYGYLVGKIGATRHHMKGQDKKTIVIRMAWRGGTSKANSRRERVFLNDEGKQQYEQVKKTKKSTRKIGKRSRRRAIKFGAD